MATPTTEHQLEQYRSNVERHVGGGLLDAEVDRLVDQQERIVKQIRSAVAPARVIELRRRPWIEIRD